MKTITRLALILGLVIGGTACNPATITRRMATINEAPVTTTTTLPYCTATQGEPCWFNPEVWAPPVPVLPDCTHYGEDNCDWHGQPLLPGPAQP
jgi:hypothetical protein